MSDTIDVPVVEDDTQTQALTVRDAVGALEKAPDIKKPLTAAQAKIEAVAQLTAAAYSRASELRLTPDEIGALQAEFGDEAFKPGAAGKENLLYIEHAFLRDRLNQVIGPGQWALIPRSRWAEDFTTRDNKPGSRVYVEAMLLVRGCFVAEAVGEMEYYPHNASQNYGDAVEGAKTAALRRCCKEFGIGLQAWKKDWCAGWWQRKNAPKGPIQHPRNTPPPQSHAPQAPPQAQAPAPGEITLICSIEMVSEKQGTTSKGKPWYAWFCLLKSEDGTQYDGGTFSETYGRMAKSLHEQNARAEIVIKPGHKQGSWEIVSILPLDGEEPVQEVVP